MGIQTNASYQGDQYGIFEKQKNGFEFRPFGKLPVLEEILECIEEGAVYVKLSTFVNGRRKVA